MPIAGYTSWPTYDTVFIVSLSSWSVYDPNPLRPNPDPQKPVLSLCHVCGLGRILTPLYLTLHLYVSLLSLPNPRPVTQNLRISHFPHCSSSLILNLSISWSQAHWPKLQAHSSILLSFSPSIILSHALLLILYLSLNLYLLSDFLIFYISYNVET